MIATGRDGPRDGSPADSRPLQVLGYGDRRQAMDQLKDGPLDDGERGRIIERATELQTLQDLADEDVARILNTSGSTWNRVKRGVYRGNSDAVLVRARAWIEHHASRADIEPGEYVDTSISRLVLAVCRRATTRRTIGLVVTAAGCGKTLGLREYARRLGDQCVLLHGGTVCRCERSLAWELAERLGVRYSGRGATAAVYRAVRDRLAGLYAGGRGVAVTVLVDEATAMRPSAVNMLRNLHDDPTCRTPVVLADTWRLYTDLHQLRGLPGGYEQLRSRAGAQYLLRADAEIPYEDVRAVAGSVLRSLDGPGRLEATALRFLHGSVANMPTRSGLAMRPGALRNVMQRLHAAADVAEAAGREATYSVAELDYVAPLVGAEREHPGLGDPFAAATPAARAAGKAAG